MLKPLRLASAVLIVGVGCATPAQAAQPPAPDLDRQFRGRQGCFILYDATAHKDVLRWHPERCGDRVVACSTFKVPLAVMAFDAGRITEATRFPWDGRKGQFDSWNQDQTPATWLSNSVVWVSQQITTGMGLPAVKRYLAAFDYGSQDMSGGLTTAWLPSGGTPTLTVSADEQVRFWDRLWSGRLKASPSAQQTVCRLLRLQTTPSGAVFSGKTGSGLVLDTDRKPTGRDIGWFVGHLEKQGHRYIVATTFTDVEKGLTKGPGGYVARQIAIDVLKSRGLW